MATIERNDLIKVKKAIEKATTASQSAKFMKQISNDVADDIKVRARKNKKRAKKDGGNEVKIKDTSTATKKIRKRYSKNLHSGTSPNTSNLTATGKLLDSIKGDGSKQTVKVKLNDTRRGRNLMGKREKVGNNDVNEYLEDMNRGFLYISKKQIKEIESDIEEKYDKEINKLLK